MQGISDLITVPGEINLDFADVKTIMHGMGMALMGTGVSSGEHRAVEAAQRAISSPLLEEASIEGAKGVLINITGGPDMTLFEVHEAASIIQEAADEEANIIFGTVIDPRMKDEVKVTVIATGFDGTKKTKPARQVTAEQAIGIETSLDERSREILAEIERERQERANLEDQMEPASPFARNDSAPESRESRVTERQAVPVRSSGADRPAYGDTDLDIPSFLRRKSD